MFIEGIRHAKKKWRAGVAVLLGLIIVSLVLSFAYFGQSVGTAPTAEGGNPLETAEIAAENAAAAADEAAGDATVLGSAAEAYLSLAAYQELYLEDASKSYEAALDYAQQMVTACGSTPDADYATAYSYVFEAYMGLGDADGISAAFNEALTVVTLDQNFVNTYYQYMYSLGAYDLILVDLEAALAIAEETAPAEGEGEEDIESPMTLAESIEELLVSAKVAKDTAE
jgi:tetratricopeptide (TPR) repeat protein